MSYGFQRARYRRRGKPGALVDFFGRTIAEGDIFLLGNPPRVGRVIRVRRASILLETGADQWDRTSTTISRRAWPWRTSLLSV